MENKVLKQLKNAQNAHFVEQIAFFKDKRKQKTRLVTELLNGMTLEETMKIAAVAAANPDKFKNSNDSESAVAMDFQINQDKSPRRPQARKFCFDEQEAKPLVRQLLEAVNKMHKFGIVHGNLNPSNLFLHLPSE